MKSFLFSFAILVVFLSQTVFAQVPKPTPKGGKTNLTKSKSTKAALNEKDEFEKAVAQTDLSEKLKALQKFNTDFPKSEKKNEALEIIFSIRSVFVDEKLKIGETENAIRIFKEALEESPNPISEGLFANVILPFPNKLFFVGQQTEALKVATMIESKIGDNPKFLLGLAAFYLGIENGNQAKSIAESALSLDPNLPAAYQTLGLAYRLKFDLEESEKAYAKALELAPDSVASKRGLAETKHAVGKPEEAAVLYKELLEKDPNDINANNGLILSLFDAGKREEAEPLLNKAIEENPKNLVLLASAAYWYAGHNEGAKAVELGQKAVNIEPRYIWGRIALARGFMAQKLPFEAEKVLLLAQKNGSFPTLDYELATARFQAGLFEEAARELKNRFAVKDNYVQTYIAGRKDVAREAESFTELLGLERRASIFMSNSADNADEAEKLKRLLDFSQKISNKNSTDEEINNAADEFVKGDDKMKAHRQLYAASRLLDTKKSLPKVLELTQGAVKVLDDSLQVNNPAAAILADELIESRSLAISKDEVIVIPDVPQQTLSKILRGRVEELMGWTLYQQDKPQEAVVRLKRAVSILPEKSTWWRSSYWKLGLALDAGGNSKDSLDALVKSYLNGQPDRFRRSIIEGVYRKVNGNTDELDKLIGPNPFPETIAQVSETPTPTPTVETSPTPTIESSPTPVAENSPSPTPTTEPTPEVKSETSPTPTPESTPSVEPSPTPKVEASSTPAVESTATPTPEPTATASPTPETRIEPTPTPETKVEPTVTPTPEAKVEPTVTPKAETSPTQKPLFDPIVIEVGKNSTTPTPTPTPTPAENKETEKTNENSEKSNDSSRPRVVVEDTIAPRSCVVVSQESISILNNGGSLGVLVGLTQDGEALKITAEPSSPNDISATLEPDIGKQSNRAFFIIKSISSNKGIYTVTFTSSCGKKEIQVKVR